MMIPRSYLFVPGNRPERFDKACAAGADVVLVDLEDAVATDEKASARAAVRGWLSADKSVVLRINGADSDWFLDDLPLLQLPGVRGALLPKAEEPATVAAIHRAAPGLPVIALVESARGLANLSALAESGIARIAFGSVDFQLDLGIAGDRDELLFARSQIVLASRLAELPPPIDGVSVALDDPEALANDIAYARRLGFGAKLAVHPKQVQPINLGFLPPQTEVEWARRVLDAAMVAGANAVRVDGKMVDRPIIERARAILDAVREATR